MYACQISESATIMTAKHQCGLKQREYASLIARHQLLFLYGSSRKSPRDALLHLLVH